MALVLVVDDSGFQRRRLRQIVESLGHQTIEAGGGDEALRIIPERAPDCITMDLLMGAGGGLATLRKLRASGHQTPVVVMTSDVQDEVRAECLEAGANEVLHKPAQKDLLAEALERMLAGANARNMRLSAAQADILEELVNMGLGKAAGALREILGARIELELPAVKAVSLGVLKSEMDTLADRKLACVQSAFTGAFSGVAQTVFAFESPDAAAAATAQAGSQPIDIPYQQLRHETLTKIGKAVNDSVMGVIGEVMAAPFNLFPPDLVEDTIDHLLAKTYRTSNADLLVVDAGLKLEEQTGDGRIRFLVEVVGFDALTAALDELESS